MHFVTITSQVISLQNERVLQSTYDDKITELEYVDEQIWKDMVSCSLANKKKHSLINLEEIDQSISDIKVGVQKNMNMIIILLT